VTPAAPLPALRAAIGRCPTEKIREPRPGGSSDRGSGAIGRKDQGGAQFDPAPPTIQVSNFWRWCETIWPHRGAEAARLLT
jgi:hypothetical protein